MGNTAPVTLKIAPQPPPPTTLAALFEAEESGLLRYAIGLVGRRSVAEELVQETLLRLHQVWDQVEHPRWRVWTTVDPVLDCDVGALYGESFVDALSATPTSSFVADGSPIAVRQGQTI